MKKGNTIEKLNGKREPLAVRLPLKEPLSITFTISNVCNLKCEYCAISENAGKRNKAFIDYDTFSLAVQSIKNAGWHLKQVVLVGLGEPLLNKELIRMVHLVKQKNIAEQVHIVTNAVQLSNEMTLALRGGG